MKYICVLDFEATCDDDMKVSHMDHEIIEFPSVLLKYDNGKIERIAEIQMYCKPKNTSILTKFCIELTGITQEQVDNGISFLEAYNNHLNWLRSNITNFDEEYSNGNVYILTCGRWDLETMIPKEYRNWNFNKNDMHNIYRNFVNCKYEYKTHYGDENVYGMTYMLNKLNLVLEGRHHSGIDDCKNIARIVEKMVCDGYNPDNAKVEVAKISKIWK